MAIIITSQNKEKIFREKNFIIIGSNSDCDYKIDIDFDLILTVKYDESQNKCVVINEFGNKKILFRGEPFLGKLVIEKFCKLKIEGSNEFIGIKIAENQPDRIAENTVHEFDVKDTIENKKNEIEKMRVSIAKQTAFAISDIKKRISLNFKAGIFLNTALIFSTVVMMFGVSNFIAGLPISDTVGFLTMPTNIKLLGLFSILGLAVSITLKQGVFLFLQNKDLKKPVAGAKFAQNFMLFISTFFMCVFYGINLIYYMNPDNRIFYSTLISLFFVLLNISIAFVCGYFKYSGHKLSLELNKYEYREDFELVLNRYQNWIDLFINNLSEVKLDYMKNKMFKMQILSLGEITLGLITAPILAYGVSNTLAMCFPEAAGWVRFSNVRISPVFLILASLLIVFAFFAISTAFLNMRKAGGSDIIKLDGFRNYFSHGVDIFGLEKMRSLEIEKIRFFTIGLSIVFIEFIMNTTFFMTEMGADLKGIFISLLAAAVPTALLIAETYILSRTSYELFVCDSLISKLDKQ